MEAWWVHILAVIGCHHSTGRTLVDVGELAWTSADAPQTVLKTAGLASIDIHQRPLEFNRRSLESTVVRPRPPLSAGAAVILAVARSTDLANVAPPTLHTASLE